MQTNQDAQTGISNLSKEQCLDRLREVFKSLGRGVTRKQLHALVSPAVTLSQSNSALDDLVANGEVTRFGKTGAPQRFWPGNLS